jgi:hypothetical protein
MLCPPHLHTSHISYVISNTKWQLSKLYAEVDPETECGKTLRKISDIPEDNSILYYKTAWLLTRFCIRLFVNGWRNTQLSRQKVWWDESWKHLTYKFHMKRFCIIILLTYMHICECLIISYIYILYLIQLEFLLVETEHTYAQNRLLNSTNSY